MKPAARLLFLAIAVAALAVGAVCLGPTHLFDFPRLLDLLRQGASTPELEKASIVLWELRLPRVILAAAAGINLALGGLLLQAVFRNPLAEPYLLGLSSGGALGAVLALAAGIGAIVLPSLAGSLIVAGAVLLFCRRRIATDLPSLLLVGVAMGALAQAFTTAIILRFDPGALRSILFWLMGSFAGRSWAEIAMVAPAALAGLAVVWILHRPLDLLSLGGESAHHLGVRVGLLQIACLIGASILAALTVAACGTIGFIGLMAPHLARRLVAYPHAFCIPATALTGAALAVGSDLLARTLLTGTELPVGVITGALGCIFFLALLRERK